MSPSSLTTSFGAHLGAVSLLSAQLVSLAAGLSFSGGGVYFLLLGLPNVAAWLLHTGVACSLFLRPC